MKVYYLLLMVLFFVSTSLNVFAQEETEETTGATASDVVNMAGGFDNFDFSSGGLDKESALGAFLGYSKIGNEGFVGMRLRPDLNFGKFGVGLNIPIMFSTDDWSFRKDEFQDGIGWARIIDYVRYGVKKRDPFYIRVGSLTGSYMGYGLLLDNYTNVISFDKRKIGATFDILIGDMVGIEGLYSDFDMASFNLLSVRPYVKPLAKTGIPIVKSVDIGYTYVTDHDKTSVGLTDSTSIQNKYIEAGQKAWSVDMGVIPINRSFMQLKVYTQYGVLKKNSSALLQETLNSIADSLRGTGHDNDNPLIKDNNVAGTNNYDSGTGFSVGADFRFNFGAKTLQLQARIERLWYNAFFTPQFYNAGYEFGKDAKLIGLAQTDGKKGIYGSLTGVFMEKVLIGGSLMIPDDVSEIAPGVLTLNFDASKLFEKFVIKGQYIKGGLTSLSDVLVFDERSLATARAAYKMYKFLVVGLDYKWTWSKQADNTFKVNNYVSPYIGFSMPLNFGAKKDPIDFNLDSEQ